MQFGTQKSLRHLWYSRPAIVVLGLVCVVLVPSVYDRFVIERQMADRAAAATAERERLEAHKVDLEERVQYLEGERGVEEEIRRNFDVAREGEEVVILTGSPKPQPEPLPEPEPVHPWWQFWR